MMTQDEQERELYDNVKVTYSLRCESEACSEEFEGFGIVYDKDDAASDAYEQGWRYWDSGVRCPRCADE